MEPPSTGSFSYFGDEAFYVFHVEKVEDGSCLKKQLYLDEDCGVFVKTVQPSSRLIIPTMAPSFYKRVKPPDVGVDTPLNKQRIMKF